METQEITFSLKIPADLNERILWKAQVERRSRQAQIIYSLEEIFRKEPRNGNGKKEKAR